MSGAVYLMLSYVMAALLFIADDDRSNRKVYAITET